VPKVFLIFHLIDFYDILSIDVETDTHCRLVDAYMQELSVLIASRHNVKW